VQKNHLQNSRRHHKQQADGHTPVELPALALKVHRTGTGRRHQMQGPAAELPNQVALHCIDPPPVGNISKNYGGIKRINQPGVALCAATMAIAITKVTDHWSLRVASITSFS
jgi:hypothetical protein